MVCVAVKVAEILFLFGGEMSGKSVFLSVFLTVFSFNAFSADISLGRAEELLDKARQGDGNAVNELVSASSNMDKQAMLSHALMLIDGIGVQKDSVRGVKLLVESARRGNVKSYAYLGLIAEEGEAGVKKSNIVALAVYDFMSQKGVSSMRREVDRIKGGMSSADIGKSKSALASILASNDPAGVISTLLSDAKVADVRMPPRTWTDRESGLTWTICNYGAAPVRNSSDGSVYCDTSGQYGGEYISVTWHEAVRLVQKSNLEGYSDWRLPTLEELLKVFKCTEDDIRSGGRVLRAGKRLDLVFDGNSRYLCPPNTDGGAFPEGVPLRDVWTMTNPEEAGVSFDSSYDRSLISKFRPKMFLRGKIVSYDTNPYRASEFVMVRGSGGAAWGGIVREAEQVAENTVNEEKAIKKRADLERERSDSEKRRIAEVMKGKLEKVRVETERMRKSPKPGDKTTQGMVVKVNGDLVEIQTYREECSLRKSDGSCNLFSITKVPAGLIWVKRQELTASP